MPIVTAIALSGAILCAMMLVLMWAAWPESADWRVVYPDGQESVRMTHKEARSYARMFGGHTRRDRHA